MHDEEKKEPTIKVEDKRHFHSDGSIKETSSPEETKETTDSKKTTEKKTKSESPPGLELNFATFILSLASSVQIALGLVPNPLTNKVERNLIAAKQTIDILGIIEEKTRGNLTDDEKNLLSHFLYELRIQYVEVKKKS